MSKTRGRNATISREDIIAAGRAIGMADLSLRAVADSLGVTPAALFHYVEDRWHLECLVGESFLAEMEVRDVEDGSAADYMLSMGMQFYDFLHAHPGLYRYIGAIFPRGESSASLFARFMEPLIRRGYNADAAMSICIGITTQAMSLAGIIELRSRYLDKPHRRADEAYSILLTDPRLSDAFQQLPVVEPRQVALHMMAGMVYGISNFAQADTPAKDILTSIEEASPCRNGESTVPYSEPSEHPTTPSG